MLDYTCDKILTFGITAIQLLYWTLHSKEISGTRFHWHSNTNQEDTWNGIVERINVKRVSFKQKKKLPYTRLGRLNIFNLRCIHDPLRFEKLNIITAQWSYQKDYFFQTLVK